MRSYAADDTTVLRKLRVPHMLPFFFTALKVGTTLAFIGAIVGEFFGGTSNVLGRVVLQAISAGQFDVAWAAIIIGAIAAILAYVAGHAHRACGHPLVLAHPRRRLSRPTCADRPRRVTVWQPDSTRPQPITHSITEHFCAMVRASNRGGHRLARMSGRGVSPQQRWVNE